MVNLFNLDSALNLLRTEIFWWFLTHFWHLSAKNWKWFKNEAKNHWLKNGWLWTTLIFKGRQKKRLPLATLLVLIPSQLSNSKWSKRSKGSAEPKEKFFCKFNANQSQVHLQTWMWRQSYLCVTRVKVSSVPQLLFVHPPAYSIDHITLAGPYVVWLLQER